MALAPATRLGPYEIVSPLGAGGMGEVYKARDTRLDRTVAIKIIPVEIVDQADARARFEREARAIAALDHPHICAVYDVGEHDGLHYLVMQHLEGETLAARLARLNGPLPLDQAFPIAIAIADALDKTHRAGITHRDLKPANIMLTRAGAKLLDFGLAKQRGPAAAPISMSGMTRLETPTPQTAQGTILGTVQYMAPEQVEGREADARSDIWAFGAVVYEMATGQRPFRGDSPASVMGAILKDAPRPVSTHQPLVPRALDHLVERCLAKDPDERWQHIGDVRHQLTAMASTAGDIASGPAAAPRRSWAFSGTVVGAVVLASMVAGVMCWSAAARPVEAPSQDLVRLALQLGPEASLANDFPIATLSPDGIRIVFVSTGADGINRLSTRRLDQAEATPLPGTERAYFPFFSPDGEWVGFFAAGKLKKTRLEGGTPVALCDAPAGRGASWSEDGRIVAALDNRTGLSMVSANGGAVTRVTELVAGDLSHRWPHVLPGGKTVVFMVGTVPGNYGAASIAVASLDGNPGRTKKIVHANAGMYPHYLPTGHLVYIANATLHALPFDLGTLEVRGTAVPVLDELSADTAFGSGQLAFSRSGTVLYRSGRANGRSVVQWLQRDGKMESLWDEPAFYQSPHLSPDGSRIAAVVSEGADADIWVFDWRRGSKTRVSTGTGVSSFPVWSPDGQYIVFQAMGQLSWARADGAERPQPLTKSERLRFPSSFTPDGKRLLFFESDPAGGSLIKVLRLDTAAGQLRAGQPELLRHVDSGNPVPTVSPDGRWVAYASSESGQYEVYVRAFPDKGRQAQVSTSGGGFPVWSRTGNELFYRTEDHRLMVSTYADEGGVFVAGRPRLWSERRLFNLGLTQNFDLAPDGKRFAALMSAEGPDVRATQRHVTLVLNFFDEVRRRVAAGQ